MPDRPASEVIPDDVKQTIKETFFNALQDDVAVEVYTLAGMNDQYNDVTVALIRALASISDKIKASFHTVGDQRSVERGVTRAPTVLIAPDQYQMRYTGAPLGEEGRSLIIAVLMASTGRTTLTEPSLKRLAGLQDKRHIQIYISPTCPYCPQQVLTAFAMAIAKPGLIAAEAIEIYENRDLADSLGSTAVPQTYINGIFTGAGLQPEPWFVDAVLTLKEPQAASTQISGEPQQKDLVIIGGGPAGLTAAIYATRAGLDCVVIEKLNPGGQVTITPVVENYPGFMRIGGKSLVDLITQQAVQYSEVHVGEYVTEVTRKEEKFHLKTNHALYIAQGIIVATGVAPRALDAPGAQKFYGRGVSYCATCDGYFFKDGKKVIVVGGGNTAVTDALYLHNLGAKVTLVHRKGELRAEERLRVSLKQSNIPVLWNSEVKEVHGDKTVRSVKIEDKTNGQRTGMAVDGVFIAIGYVANADIAKQLGVETDDQGYIKVDLSTMRTSVPSVYAAGDITGAMKQIVVAVAQGSIAAMTAFEDLQSRVGMKGS
jgi:thioredoxin reductase (NADPH)